MDLRTTQIKKILIIKLAAIGDVMFASPLVENLRVNFPKAQIHWLGDSWTKQVLEHIPHLDKLLFYDRPWLRESKFRGYLEIPKLLRKLRRESYNLAVIPHRSNLAFRLAKFAGIPLGIGFIEGKSNKNLDVEVNYDSLKHEVERNLDLLRALGLKIKSNRMSFDLDQSLLERVQKAFLKDKKGRNLVCLGPGGGKNPGLDMPLKRWPEEKYLNLAEKLRESGAEIILVGSDGDNDVCGFISRQSDVLNLCGKTKLAETAAIIKSSDLYIGNDSAPLYIAAAVGTPTIGIYGPTDPQLLAPLEENSTYVINKTDCSPCYHPGSIVQGEYKECNFNQKCLSDLQVEQVLGKVLEKLNG